MSALPLPTAASSDPVDPPATDVAPLLSPAHLIRSDGDALDVAARLAEGFARDASLRDRERRLPWAELTRYSASGLGGITVPREHGGAAVSYRTLAEVFKLFCAADPALGHIPQNHFGILEVMRHAASPAQQARIFRGGRYSPIVGGVERVADELEAWVRETDIDGFNLARTVTPECFEDFVNLVVPELQSRGSYKTAYANGPLREKLFGAGQARLPARHTGAGFRRAGGEAAAETPAAVAAVPG